MSVGDRYTVELCLNKAARQNGINVGQFRRYFEVCKVHGKWKEGQPIGIPLKVCARTFKFLFQDSIFPNEPGFIYNQKPEDVDNDRKQRNEYYVDQDFSDASTLTDGEDQEIEGSVTTPIGDQISSEFANNEDLESEMPTEATDDTESIFYQADWEDF